MLRLIRRDIRSTTGNNLRKILLLTDKNNVELLVSSDAMRIKYQPIKLEDQWNVGMIQEINQMRNDKLEIKKSVLNREDSSQVNF